MARGWARWACPATFPPASRYVKAAFLKLNSPDPGSEEERVVQFFHLLEGVAMVRGSVVTPEGREDITTYSCCISAGAGVYYYKTYGNSRITAVRLAGAGLDGDALTLYPLQNGPDIRFEN